MAEEKRDNNRPPTPNAVLGGPRDRRPQRRRRGAGAGRRGRGPGRGSREDPVAQRREEPPGRGACHGSRPSRRLQGHDGGGGEPGRVHRGRRRRAAHNSISAGHAHPSSGGSRRGTLGVSREPPRHVAPPMISNHPSS